jgi:hypothetical protein
VSSNLTDGIVSSLRIRTNNNKDEENKNRSIEDFKSESRTYAYKQPSQIVTSRFKIRDLYNREKRLGYCIVRIKIKANAKDVIP